MIEAWVPLFLFAVLFGLSMDYQVFLLSRIRERYSQTRRHDRRHRRSAIASTARIITGAALIIVAVFAGFAAGDLVMFQQMGFGIAVALLIDATLVRSVLVPAAMKLLGEWNWYLPGWLAVAPAPRRRGPRGRRRARRTRCRSRPETNLARVPPLLRLLAPVLSSSRSTLTAHPQAAPEIAEPRRSRPARCRVGRAAISKSTPLLFCGITYGLVTLRSSLRRLPRPTQAQIVAHSATQTRRGSAPSSADLLGQPDENALGASDVAEPIHVLVLDHFVDELRAVLAEPGERVVEVVHGEHDAEVAEGVHRGVPVIGDHRRREKSRELEPAVAVRRTHHGDLDALVAQSSDAP